MMRIQRGLSQAVEGVVAPLSLLGGLTRTWRRLSLASKFAVTAAIVIVACMTLLSVWVNSRIVKGVVQNAASNAALYLVGFVEPHIQELSTHSDLPIEAQKKIDALLESTVLRDKRIVTIKIWGRGGKLVYDSDKTRIGKVFQESPALRAAWLGEVTPEYDDLSDIESDVERSRNLPMLEVYAPVRHTGTNEVIAVVEI